MARPQNPLASFIWGAGGQALTPEEIAMQRELMARREAKGIDTSPVGHWTQGAARVVDALGGVLKQRRIDQAATANTVANAELSGPLIEALSGGAAYPSSVAAGGSSMAPEAVGLSVGEAPTRIKAKLVERGLPEHVADGFVMNFADESGFNPSINEAKPTVPGSRGGYGLYQLTGPRRKAYEQFAAQRGVSVGDEDAQLDFLVSELQGPEAGAARRIFAAPDAGTAAAAIATNFLRPAASHLKERVARYTAGGGAPVQTASLDPSVGVTEATRPQGISRTGQPMLVYDDKGMRMESPSAMPTEPHVMPDGTVMAGGANSYLPNIPTPELTRTTPSVPMPREQMPSLGGSPMAQPPAPDITSVPALSGANGLPFEQPAAVVPTGAPQTSPGAGLVEQGRQPTGIVRVAAALPIRAQATPGDVMVAGPEATEQPMQPTGTGTDYFPPAPTSGAGGGNAIAAAVRAMSDPRATNQTKQVAALVIQQAQAQQRAQAENQQWMARQAYEAQQKAADPMTALAQRKAELEVRNLENPQEKVPDSVRALRIRAAEAGLVPGTPQYAEFMVTGGREGQTINVNTQEGSKFYNKLDEKNAEVYSGLSEAGIQARSKRAMVSKLEERLAKAPQGGIGALKAWAGELGIPFEGTDDIQAATALINRMVPEQRQPGSGTMSDADLLLFKASLPRILNQPDGNQAIISDLKSISDYQIKMGEIADRVADRELTPAEGRAAIRSLPNPLQSFLDRSKEQELNDQDEGWKEISPGVRVRPVQ